MSLALHGHQILLITAFVFAAAVLTPNWYTSPNGNFKFNVFQVCAKDFRPELCRWIFSANNNVTLFQSINLIYPTIVAAFALGCAATTLLALLLGSWYLKRTACQIESKWILILTLILALFSFLFSCVVWAMMLTINLQQNSFGVSAVRLSDFDFSFWINIGASSLYLYAVFIYTISIFTAS